MRWRRATSTAAACVCGAAALALAPASGAATDVGNDCVATGGAAGFSFVQLTKASGGLPLSTPGPGVVTRWRVMSAAVVQVTQRLRVYRPTGAPDTFTTVGESAIEAVPPGASSFAARIPVQADDRFGAYGSPPPFGAPLFCETGDPANSMGIVEGDTPVGSTNTFMPVGSGYLVAVAATVEPDADGDGFGDETQDACPQSAVTQEPCPPVVLTTLPLAKRQGVTVLVAATATASVTLTGSARLPAAGGRGRASAQAKLPKVTRPVTAGSIARVTLRFPAKLRAALAALPRNRSLSLRLTATAPNLAGAATVERSRLKLRGRARAE